MRLLILGLTYLLGLVFLTAGVSKVLAFGEFVAAVKAYGLPEGWLTEVTLPVVVTAELLVVVLLSWRTWSPDTDRQHVCPMRDTSLLRIAYQ